MYFNYLDGEPEENKNKDVKLDQLQSRVQELLLESKDAGFTEYLKEMGGRLNFQQRQIDLLSEELDRRYQMYCKNLQIMNTQAQMQAQAEQPAQEVSVQPQIEQPAQYQYGQSQQTPVQPEKPAQYQYGQSQQTPVQPLSAVYQPKQKRNVEFTIGAAVLSIVGSVFILISLVLLGMNFMNGFVKGMSLYVIFLAVMALSELLLYKRWPKLGMTLSSVGMGGLYISTLINYIVLKNFNQWIALGITAAITIGIIFLSRKRNAVSYRILGMAAVYVCILISPLKGESAKEIISQTDFVVVTIIILLINIMCLLVPVEKARTEINIVHMSLNTAFTTVAFLVWPDDSPWNSFAEMWHRLFFVAVSLLIMQLILISHVRMTARKNPESTLRHDTGICIAYGVCGFIYVFLVGYLTDFVHLINPVVGEATDVYLVHRIVCAAVIVGLGAIPLLVLGKRQEKWFSWYLINLLVWAVYMGAKNDWEMTCALAVLLIAAKILSFTANKMLYISDAVLTTYVCLMVMHDYSYKETIPLAVILILSVACINYWKTYFSGILTFSIAWFVSMNMLEMLKAPVFVGILLVGLLIFNNVGRLQDKYIVVYNWVVLAGQVLCYLTLINPVYNNAYITYLCMLVFGITTIVIFFQEKYHMKEKIREMVLAVFLTYMALVIQTSYPIVNSILIMVIALICVGMGFAKRQKPLRIYGLVLSLAVCVKIVAYDFLAASTVQKMLVFFIAGLLALGISAIYMILEKKQTKDQEEQTDYEKQSVPEQQAVVSEEQGRFGNNY